MLNRIYRGTPAVASWGIQKPGRLYWRNRSARTPKNRDKTNLGVSQALLSVGITPPGCDWPLGLNRQPAGACTGTTPSNLLVYANCSLKSRGKCVGEFYPSSEKSKKPRQERGYSAAPGSFCQLRKAVNRTVSAPRNSFNSASSSDRVVPFSTARIKLLPSGIRQLIADSIVS